MNADNGQNGERRALRRAFFTSLLARMNPLLVLRGFNSRGEGPTVQSSLPAFSLYQGDRLRHSLTLVPPEQQNRPQPLYQPGDRVERYSWALRIRLRISITARAEGIGVIGCRMTMTRRVSGDTCTG